VYWTVLDDELQVVEAADRFLMNVRLSKDRAKSTTKSYAGAIAMFLRWCVTTGRDWHTAARDLSSFVLWLKWQPGLRRTHDGRAGAWGKAGAGSPPDQRHSRRGSRVLGPLGY
jgi:hypothetical protein